MNMTAMESLMDPNMVYLDLLAGITGVVLSRLIVSGLSAFKFSNVYITIAFAVLISRIIVDYLYDALVSKSDAFGGSMLEFGASSIVWLCIVSLVYPSLTWKNKIVLYLSTVVMMLAIARATRWG